MYMGLVTHPDVLRDPPGSQPRRLPSRQSSVNSALNAANVVESIPAWARHLSQSLSSRSTNLNLGSSSNIVSNYTAFPSGSRIRQCIPSDPIRLFEYCSGVPVTATPAQMEAAVGEMYPMLTVMNHVHAQCRIERLSHRRRCTVGRAHANLDSPPHLPMRHPSISFARRASPLLMCSPKLVPDQCFPMLAQNSSIRSLSHSVKIAASHRSHDSRSITPFLYAP